MFDLHVWAEMKAAQKPIVALTAYDFPSALAINHAEVDMILVGDSLGNVVLGHEDTTRVRVRDMCHHVKAVARARPRAPIVADMPFMSFGVDIGDTLYNARKLLRAGAVAVKLEGGSRIAAHIEALLQNNVPVVGHLGLTPQSILRFGSYRVRGKTPEEAKKIAADAKLLDDLGVSAIVLESIPEALGDEITRAVNSPTIGIGAGRMTDGQILVFHDLLGFSDPNLPQPRFVKRFAAVFGEMVNGLQAYADAVRSGAFPEKQQVYYPVEKKKRTRAS